MGWFDRPALDWAPLMDGNDTIAERLYGALIAAQREAGDDAVAQALDKLAASTGQNTIRHAAAIIRGRTVGRNAIDDRAALRRVEALRASRGRDAIGIVAAEIAGSGAADKRVAAIGRRLRRKLAQNEMDKIGLSISTVA